MADWNEKFNTLASTSYKVSNDKEWKFSLEENKQKGTLQLNARQFKIATTEGGYSGASKNGFIIPINALDDLDNIKECFNKFVNFIDDAKEFL
jgi:hypothetical protein